MKKSLKKILCASLAALFLMVTFASCAKQSTENDNKDNTSAITDDGVSETEAKAPDTSLEIKINLLTGTTALGMAQLIDKVNNDQSEMNYKIELSASADAVTGPIVSGDCDIAALPTNVAAKLYKASAGKVKLLAINTLGVLYLLSNGESIDSFEDLRGKTVYLPGAGSNPEYITAALFEAKGLNVGTDVILDTTSYPSPDALSSAVAAGQAKLAVLPEPKVTVTTSSNSDVSVAMDLTEEWEQVYGKNTMVQGCLVVNSDFAEAHPAELNRFLDDYKASVEFISEASEEAIAMIVAAGIIPKAPLATKALPNCNICFIEGNEMKTAISVFYEKIYAYDQKSIAAMPDDGFYYSR